MKRGKRPGFGSSKGAAFERLIAKEFSLWVSAGKSQDLLWRSAGSGGRSTQRAKQTGRGIEYHASDIAPLHPDAAPFVDVFTLECKSYRSIELRQIVYDWSTSTIAKWWGRACRDARSVDRVPLMVVKENQKPALLVCPDCFMPSGGGVQLTKGAVYVEGAGVYIKPLKDVLEGITFNVFRGLYVPTDRHHRPAPDRQRIRRIPLVDI